MRQTVKSMGFYPDFNVRLTVYGTRLKNSDADRLTRKQFDEEIKALAITDSDLIKVPSSLSWSLRNIQVLYLNNCNIQFISNQQLKVFENLKELWMMKNKIEHLHGELFKYSTGIEKISFESNQIFIIGSGLLHPLKHLKLCDLRNNIVVDIVYDTTLANGTALEDVKKLFSSASFDHLKSLACLSEYKDFTIRTEKKNFKVNKLLMAAQSSVFAEIISKHPTAKSMKFSNIKSDVLENVLEFVYHSKLSNDNVNILEIYAAASRLNMKSLEEFAGEKLLAFITEANAFQFLIFSHKLPHTKLKAKAFATIRNTFHGKCLCPKIIEDVNKLKQLFGAKRRIERKTRMEIEKLGNCFGN